MDLPTLFIFFIAALVLVLGMAGQAFFRRTRVPELAWLILFGVALSFLMSPADKAVLTGIATPFGTLALIMILLDAGMGFDLTSFSNGIRRGVMLTLVAFVATVAVTAAFTSAFLGWPLLFGVLLGIILGDASQAVIVPLINEMRLSEKLRSILTIETTLTDVLVIVCAIAVIGMISTGSADLAGASLAIGYSVVVGLVVAVAGAIAWLSVEDAVERKVHSHFLMFAVVLILYVFTEIIGGTGAFTALIFGLAVGNIPAIKKRVHLPEHLHLNKTVKNFYSEIDFFIRSFFFVYMGLVLSPSDWTAVGIGAVLAAILFAGRFLSAHLALSGSGLNSFEKLVATVMVSRGLTSAVVSQLPAAMLVGVAFGQDFVASIGPIVVSVIFFSIALNIAGAYLLGSKGK